MIHDFNAIRLRDSTFFAMIAAIVVAMIDIMGLL